MIILRQKEYARKDYEGLTEKGVEALRKSRKKLAKTLLNSYKTSHKAFKDNWDRREGAFKGLQDEAERLKERGVDLTSTIAPFKFWNERSRREEREDYNKHLQELLKVSKENASTARRSAEKIGRWKSIRNVVDPWRDNTRKYKKL